MGNIKHTPGEWVFIKQPESNGIENDVFLGDIITHRRTGNNWSIAGIWGDINEAEANAQLIAASPTLLEACEKVRVKMLDIWGVFGGGHQVNELFEILNIAIAKATGKEVSDESK